MYWAPRRMIEPPIDDGICKLICSKSGLAHGCFNILDIGVRSRKNGFPIYEDVHFLNNLCIKTDNIHRRNRSCAEL